MGAPSVVAVARAGATLTPFGRRDARVPPVAPPPRRRRTWTRAQKRPEPLPRANRAPASRRMPAGPALGAWDAVLCLTRGKPRRWRGVFRVDRTVARDGTLVA